MDKPELPEGWFQAKWLYFDEDGKIFLCSEDPNLATCAARFMFKEETDELSILRVSARGWREPCPPPPDGLVRCEPK